MRIEVKITDDSGVTADYVVLDTTFNHDFVFANSEKIAIEEFKNVGDEGLFPNHTDKDIWISGFKTGFFWIFKTLIQKQREIRKEQTYNNFK